MKKISIIVPVYNGEQRIDRCLDSIITQTYENIEIIVLNDGSTDLSDEIIRQKMEHFHNDRRTVIYEYHNNQGVAKTRNYGIQIATGDYVTFVDQDDYLTDDYIENYMKYVQKEEYDVVVGGYKRISDEGNVLRVVSLTEKEWSKFIITAPWAHIYKTDLLRKNNIEFLTTGLGEDVYFNLLVYAYTNKVKILFTSDYMWVNNPKSVSNSKQNKIRFDRSPIFLLDKLVEAMPADNTISYECLEFYCLRYIVWYSLFTVRGSKTEDVATMYDLLDDWLNVHFPNHMKNPNISFFRPKGDLLSVKISVMICVTLKRMHLLKKSLVLAAKLSGKS